MKQWIVAWGAMWVGLAGHAQTIPTSAIPAKAIPLTSPIAAAPATPAPSPTPTAIPTTKPDNARYLAEPSLLEACQAELDAFNDKPCDVIFIGGTIAAGFRGPGKAIWQKYYDPRRALNFSISGDSTQNVLWRLNNMSVSNLHPKVAVMLIGQGNSSNTVHEIADGIKTVLVNTQVAFAGVKIILVSIVPNAREHDKMMQVNTIIRSYADASTVYFVNLVPLMPVVTGTNADGSPSLNYKGIGPDHVVPDAAGYQIWADAMEPVMAKLLGAAK